MRLPDFYLLLIFNFSMKQIKKHFQMTPKPLKSFPLVFMMFCLQVGSRSWFITSSPSYFKFIHSFDV
jgi:hypothetical protein